MHNSIAEIQWALKKRSSPEIEVFFLPKFGEELGLFRLIIQRSNLSTAYFQWSAKQHISVAEAQVGDRLAVQTESETIALRYEW